MERAVPHELDWSAKTIAISLLASLLGAFVGLSLKKFGEWPFPSLSEYAFAGFCGGAAVYLLHPKRPLIVFAVFVPVMAAASLLIVLLFYAYILGAPVEF